MPMEIDSAFAGGNIVVDRVADGDVSLHQDLGATSIDWFYWCFRVRGAAGRTVRFSFTASPALGVRGPAMSLDGGETWYWLGPDVVEGNAFRWSCPARASEVRLSFGMPYLESHWRQFMADVGHHPSVVQGTLCVSEKGRDVEYLVLRCRNDPPRHRVVITCRHHCCEMMANYVLEGLVRWAIRDPAAEWLRRNVEFLLVPFVDKDGVEEGNQGKWRRPRDHWMDYEGASTFASTRAIRERIPIWGDGCLRVALDIHCPHIAGQFHESIYLVGSQVGRIDAEQRRFSQVLESSADGDVPFIAEDFLPFGDAWNTTENYVDGRDFGDWIADRPEVALATTIEVPYANARGTEVNQASARRFGVDLGKGLSEYLKAYGIRIGCLRMES